ncbi:glycosyltransferase family 2 protein [Candidatus Magnetomonas plexicatena]|uniref:glycosyltransferase family 2 protein n=1 Tax=Candidatus Magnetomonas plexicatena TaxID=2552947 RepID=UPI001C753BF7|nr:glycosyltransferase family 2 protein [Nitrospirales bacterium LBB_01]
MFDNDRDAVKVSVIIPTYNRSKYVRKAVDGVIGQTYKNIEILVIDDGSTDDTKEVLAPLVGKGVIKYIYQKNRGPSAARNTGLSHATGDCIAFCDADDYYNADMLKALLDVLYMSDDIGMVFCDYNTFSDTGVLDVNRNAARYEDMQPVTFQRLFSTINFIMPSTVLAKRIVFEKCGVFDESLKGPEDYDLWLRILKHYEIAGTQKALVNIRVHEGNISKHVDRMVTDEAAVIEKYRHSVPSVQFKKRLSKVFMLNADRCVCQKHYAKGLVMMLKGMSVYPFMFNDILIIAIRLIIGESGSDRLRKQIGSLKWLKKIYFYIYRN